MTGGMLPQEPDTLAVMKLCRQAGKPVCVGGPAPTSTPAVYRDADYLVIGEAEGAVDALVAAIESGTPRGVFEAPKYQTDVTKSPIPRFDLLNRRNYRFIGVQFSRGCPFQCEFCDIIELFGNNPRAKTTPQMLAELEVLFKLGHRGQVDFVDDNLIGNKKALKKFLPELIQWQKRRNYPFRFSTEASLNLADDPELLSLLRAANFFAVFVGIESPDPETLIMTRKKQNTRRDIVASIRTLYASGLVVAAGFIVGFDTEKGSVAGTLTDFIQQTAIPTCTVGLLTALPNTQLARRLLKEGRLDTGHDLGGIYGDQAIGGLNFATLRPKHEVLGDCRDTLAAIYAPKAYFARLETLALTVDRPVLRRIRKTRRAYWLGLAIDLMHFFGLLALFVTRQPDTVPSLLRVVFKCFRRNRTALPVVMENVAAYLDLRPFSQTVVRLLNERIAAECAAQPVRGVGRLNTAECSEPVGPSLRPLSDRRPVGRLPATP
jgi:radical SAM superfamily enzyme YgiQ (UPF0313 family)